MPRRIVTVALAALALVAGGCSRDGDDGAGRQPPTATTAAPGAPASPAADPPAIQFAVSGVDANGTRAPDEATVAAVMAGVDRWVAAAVVGPLRTGQPAGDLSAVFVPAALERLADPAVRAALVDEGMPAASSITATTATAALASVAGPDELVALVAVQIDLKLTATGPSLNVDVGHNGELVLVPEGDSWKIESFLIHTSRDSRE